MVPLLFPCNGQEDHQKGQIQLGLYYDTGLQELQLGIPSKYQPKFRINFKIDPTKKFVPSCFTIGSGDVEYESDTICGLVKLKKTNYNFLLQKSKAEKPVKMTRKGLTWQSVLSDRAYLPEGVNPPDFETKFGPWECTINSSYQYFSLSVRNIYKDLGSFNEKTLGSHLQPDADFRNKLVEIFFDFNITNQLLKGNKISRFEFKRAIFLYELEYAYKHNTTVNGSYSYFALHRLESGRSIRVDSIKNNAYSLSFLDRDMMVYEQLTFLVDKKFRSSLDFVRSGTQRIFDDKGNLVKEIIYQEGKKKKIKIYHLKEKLTEIYQSDSKTLIDVLDENHKSVLDSILSHGLTFTDHNRKVDLHKVYNNGSLNAIYYLDQNGEKIYILAKDIGLFKFFEQFAMKVEANFDDFEFQSAQLRIKDGYTLFHCIVNKDGAFDSVELLDGNNHIIDDYVLKILKSKCLGKKELVSASFNDQEVKQSFVLPMKIAKNKVSYQAALGSSPTFINTPINY